MDQRLIQAATALQKAYEADPSDPIAAAEMLRVELGNPRTDRTTMEKWFSRAIAANPQHLHAYPYVGHTDAYDIKLRYLLPRWHGSAADMLQFGRQCAATHNWRDGVTWVLMEAHLELASESPDSSGYWRLPGVWQDVQSVLHPPAVADPKDHEAVTMIAYWAWKCGQWKEADQAFKALGGDVQSAIFGGNDACEAARVESAANAGG
jgi:hypothetical protein